MEASFITVSSHGRSIDEEDELSPLSSFSGDSDSSTDSTSSDFMEDATSSSALSLSPSPSDDQLVEGPLYQMSSLMAQLPFKRGLSKHYQGKSQSFTSLSNVRSLEDLAKPERSYRKKLKPCKSFGGGLDINRYSLSPKGFSKTISKKSSKGSLSYSLIEKRNSFLGSNKPPFPPHNTSNHSPQTLLFT